MITKSVNTQNRTSLKVVGRNQRHKFLCIPISEGKRVTRFSDILYLKSDSNYTEIYLTDGKMYCVCRTIKTLEEQIPETEFIRIHRSYVVAASFIKYIYTAGSTVELTNGLQLPMSKTGRARVVTYFEQ